MLDDAGPRGLAVRIVDGGVALEAGLVEQLILKPDGAVFQRAELVVKISVDWAGVDDLVGQCVQRGLVFEVIGVQPNLDAVEQVGDHLRIAADGNTLIQCIEIVVVKGQPHGQALDDERRQILAVAAPLLFGVALDELLVDVAAYKGDGLLLEVLRLVGDLAALLLDLGGCLLRRYNTPHFIKGVHIEGQRVELTLIVGNRRVCKAVELGKPGDIVPDLFVVGVEDVRTVFVDMDALHALGVDVARNVGALIHDQHGFAVGLGLMGEDGTVQAGADYQIIIFHITGVPLFKSHRDTVRQWHGEPYSTVKKRLKGVSVSAEQIPCVDLVLHIV